MVLKPGTLAIFTAKLHREIYGWCSAYLKDGYWHVDWDSDESYVYINRGDNVVVLDYHSTTDRYIVLIRDEIAAIPLEYLVKLQEPK